MGMCRIAPVTSFANILVDRNGFIRRPWLRSLSPGAACDLHCKAEIREWNQLRSNSPAANRAVSLANKSSSRPFVET